MNPNDKLLKEYRKKARAIGDAFIDKKISYDDYQANLWALRRDIESRWDTHFK